MTQEELSKLTDQELLNKQRKMKSNAITHAVLIGFMVGLVIYSIAKNSIGFFTLIPLFFIFQLTKNSNDTGALKELLKERNLK